MIPPWIPPQLGQPTITGTIVVCPFCWVVIHVLPVQAVFEVDSVEKLCGADVRVLVMRETLIELVESDGLEPDPEVGADVTVGPKAVPTDDPGLTCEAVEIVDNPERPPD